MKRLVFLSIAFLSFELSYGQVTLETIKGKWRQKQYKEVIELGIKLRATLKGRGIPALDFMVLSSICMTASPRSGPCADIKFMLQDYYIGLPAEDYQLMEAGFSRICDRNLEPDVTIDELSTHQYAHSRPRSVTQANFKTYALISEGLRRRGAFYKISEYEVRMIVQAFTDEKNTVGGSNDSLISHFINRRVPKGDMVSIKKAVARFNTVSKYSTSDHFLVITSKSNNINTRTVADNMENVFRFYQKAYKLPSSEYYFTIYLTDNYQDIGDNLKKLYASRVFFDPIGYSNIYDNSMVAWIKNSESVGTLKHELIHLLLRATFNFSPEWFEEGLASLYEESQFDKSFYLQGKQNWRGVLLKKTNIHYTLADLFSAKDVEFNAFELEYFKEEIQNIIQHDTYLKNYYKHHPRELDYTLMEFLTNRAMLYKNALSRYFLLYLQDKSQLSKMYTALLQRDKSIFSVGSYRTQESVILDVCQKTSLEELQLDFDQWFRSLSIKDRF